MKYYIDPKIDCVFKAILGALGREHLLVHFLNAVVQFHTPIVKVTIENPYIEREQINSKLNIVDIKARDSSGRIYQIEMQLTTPAYLLSRMVQNLSQLHGQQLKKGDDLIQTKEALAIWLLINDIGLHDHPKVAVDDHQFHFQMYEKLKDIDLPNSTHLHIVQMNRWRKPKKPAMKPLDYWIYFFMRANNWKHLPNDASIPEIQEAMTVLESFADDPEKYAYYQSRNQIQLAEISTENEYRKIRQQRDQLVQNLLDKQSMTVEQISEITALSVEEINEIVAQYR